MVKTIADNKGSQKIADKAKMANKWLKMQWKHKKYHICRQNLRNLSEIPRKISTFQIETQNLCQ